MNRTTFFAYIRRAPFGGRLTQSQIDGIDRLLAMCAEERVTDIRHKSCLLANVVRETGARMQPVREAFADSDRQAIARLNAAYAAGKMPGVRKPYWREGWFGRGDIQQTHRANYLKMGMKLGVDLVNKPSLALDPKISARIAVVGMRDGLFTGRKLSDYFSGPMRTPAQEQQRAVAARAIVNGNGDKAHLIAGYFRNFLDAFMAAEQEEAPADVKPRAAEPDDVPAEQSWSLRTMLGALFSGTFTIPFIGEVQNAYALGAVALLLFAGGIMAWLIFSGRISINRKSTDVDMVAGSSAVVDMDSPDADPDRDRLALPGPDLDRDAEALEGGADRPRRPRRRVSSGKAQGRRKRKGAPAKARRTGRAKATGAGS